MKKVSLLLCSFMWLIAAWPQSSATFTQGESQTVNKRVSPNGKYLVGETTKTTAWGLDNLSGYASFLQDVEQGTRTWLTSFDVSDCELTGSFTDVTDDGVISGVMKDPDNCITFTEMGSTYTLPLNVAAIWQKNGTLTKLGLGDYQASDFKQFADGTFATALSNDAKVVVGYAAFANYAKVFPVGWFYNETTQAYDFKHYAMPEGYVDGRILDVCGDGSVAVGYVVKPLGARLACYWPTPDECVIIENTNPVGGVQNNGVAYVISNNGKYIGCTLNGREPVRGVLIDKANHIYQWQHLGQHPGYIEVSVDGITDAGDLIGIYKYPVQSLQRPFYLISEAGKKNVDFDYFIYLQARDIQDKIPYTFTHFGYESVSFSGMSADGKIIVGNDPYTTPWVLSTPQNFVMVPESCTGVKGRATALGEVTLTANKLYNDHLTLYQAEEYVFYRDGKEVGRVSLADLGEGHGDITFVDKDVRGGAHYYSVAINWKHDITGDNILCPRTEEIIVNMDPSFDFPLFDDFETSSIATQGWYIDRQYGDVALQNIGCGPYYGLNWSKYLNWSVFQFQPYSYALNSRHMDATKAENVYMSFARVWGYVNQTDWDLTKDTLSIEITSDDEHWERVMDYCAANIDCNRWGFEHIDLTPWAAGKVFQLRFRAHGQAASQTLWKIDDVRIDEEPLYLANEGVKGVNLPDGTFRLTWKNSLDAYGLNYYGNRMFNVEHRSLGNEGNPLIGVNKYDKADLFMYVGKYLTSITTELNYIAEMASKPLRAAIVVYENGKLVREQEIEEPVYNVFATYQLDEPLQVKAGTELMIGVKLLDYDEQQTPIRYQNTSDYADGKSNIYSEDNGVTWLNMADYFEQVPGHESEGYGSWLITANITDAPEMTADQVNLDQYAIEVYKNGEKCRDLFIDALQGWFNDENSKEGDTYQIRTFYLSDGTCSELSEAVVNNGQVTAIEAVEDANNDAYIVKGETLYINGSNSNVVLYNAAGTTLYSGNASSLNLRAYGHGCYILKVTAAEGGEQTYKFVY